MGFVTRLRQLLGQSQHAPIAGAPPTKRETTRPAPVIPEGDWGRAEYSCLCDDDSCEACRRLDGLAIAIDDPRYRRYEPPHPECTSPEGCRCVWVLISKSETKAVR
ncbi:MAG: hypothetical protein ACYC5O_00670 [Anaerolineae bacterium]